MSSNRRRRLQLAALAALSTAGVSYGTPAIQTLSDSGGTYYLVNNGGLTAFKLYKSGSNAGKITSIIYDGQQMVGGKSFYYDIQGSPGIYLGAGQTYAYRTGSNFIDITADQPATTTAGLNVTWHWILRDGDAGFSSYLTYHHTAAMADYYTNEQRLGAQFYNGSLFKYSSITDNFWGYQDAGDPKRDQGRFITGETAELRGIPGEYTKSYETKYDWRSTYAESGGVTGIFTAPNTSLATGPQVASNYGAWTIMNPRSYESWNAGPTHPQTPVADGASIIPSPAGSHFGGPGLNYTGDMDKAFGPIYNYFNKSTTIDSLRADAKKFTVGQSSTDLNNFYDSINLPYYATTAQRGTVTGKVRTSDGLSLDGATVILSAFDSTAYAADPLGQEYQRRAAGYNYWIAPNKDGTFSIPDVRPGKYRMTVIKPGYYREGTYDNITVSAGASTAVPNFTFVPDVAGKALWQVGTFDRTAGEFKHGDEHNNWLDAFDYTKDFPNGVNYTVDSNNPTNDTTNWANNWGLNQMNPDQDFWSVNFNLASAPAANTTVTLSLAVADQQFINDIGALVYKTGNTSYNRVDAGFDHDADNAPGTFRSGETSSRVLYRKLSFPGSWLHSGANKIAFHIVGGNMQWDALRLDIQNPGTFSVAQWNGGVGNWTDASKWLTQQYGYTAINKGTANLPNNTSTTFTDGATNTAPVNNSGSTLYYDAVINGGTVTLNTTAAIQKLSLLEGTLNVTSGTPVLTANDAVVLGGATVTGTGTLNALTTTTLNFNNTIAGGFKVNSTGAVTWIDGANLTVTGAGSQWTNPGFNYGVTAPSTITLATNGTLATGAGTLSVGPFGSLTMTGGKFTGASINNAGTLTADAASSITLTAGFTNSGNATLNGPLVATAVTNTGGLLVLNGTNTYTGGTSITGGAVQFASLASIGGSGANVTVASGGAASYTPGITTAGFLSRLNTASTGALALTAIDSATALNFTAGALAPFASMGIGAVGNVTYTGVYTPAGNTYRLGGGGGVLTYSPAITGAAGVIIGNTGSSGAVILNATNSYTGVTTIKGGVLAVASLADGGLNSPIGSSSNAAANLILDGGTLSSIGAATTNRLFTLGTAGATIDGAAGAMNFTNTAALTIAGSGNRTLTLTGSNATNNFSPAIADPATGITALTKSGTGTWTLGTGAKTYGGDTSILAGTLKLAAGASLPSGAGKGNVSIETGATLQLNGQDLSINGLNDGPVGAITATNPNGWATANGPGGGALDNTGATKTLTLGNNNAAGLYSGVISGALNLIKAGTGTQILSGDNTYAGTTTINAGTLQVGIGGTPNSYGPGDGGFRGKLGAGNIINNATLQFNRGYLTTVSNIISGTGTLKQTANASLVLTAANTYTGPTVIGAGIANIGQGNSTQTGLSYTGDCAINANTIANGGNASSIGASSNAAANLILDGGTLYYSSTTAASTDRLFTVTQNGGAIYTGGALNFTNTGAIVMSGTGDRTLALAGETSAVSTFSADIGDPSSGKTSLTKDHQAPWTINASALLTYSGDTFIRMGTLKLATGAALPYGTGKGNLVFDTSTDFGSDFPAIFDMGGNDVSINGLSGGVAAGTYWSVTNAGATKTLNLGNNNATATFNGKIIGGIALTKTGTGVQTLTNSNNNTGATNVSAGTLTVTATGGLTNSLNFTVSSGATLNALGAIGNAANVTVAGTANIGPNIGTLTGGGEYQRSLGALIIQSGGLVKLQASASHATRSLVVLNSYTNSGKFDISDNDVVIHSVGAGTLAQVVSQIKAARASTPGGGFDGTWTGTSGLTSSAVISSLAINGIEDRSIGYLLVGDYFFGGVSSFDGVAVTSTDLLIKYTRNGDANLSGVVDDNDVSLVGAFYGDNLTTHHWYDGDFDGNGKVNDNDVAVLGTFYDLSQPALGATALNANYGPTFAAAFFAGLSQNTGTVAVPEPAAVSLLGIGMIAGLARRRRQTTILK